ncbi:MAG TPA: ABC transporter, partial [Pseudomonas sp.]|nr:ABC transporter [Pseudomonas sp.]
MNYAVTLSHLRLGAAAAAILVLTGCATTASNPQDPLE